MIKQVKKTIAKVLLTSMVLTMAPVQVTLLNTTSAYAEVEAATVTYMTVKSQKALDKALKNKKIKTIYLSDNKGKNVSYKISGNHSDKQIVVENYHAKLTFTKTAKIDSLTVYVTTQKQLDKWLNNSWTTEIVIKTDKERTFAIDSKDYSSIKLTVNAKNSTITNDGTFKKVAVKKGEYIAPPEEAEEDQTVGDTTNQKPSEEEQEEQVTVTPTPTTSASTDVSNIPVVPSVPTTPTQIPVQPTEAPVEPTEAPVEPTEAPVEPTETPVQPTETPTQPTESEGPSKTYITESGVYSTTILNNVYKYYFEIEEIDNSSDLNVTVCEYGYNKDIPEGDLERATQNGSVLTYDDEQFILYENSSFIASQVYLDTDGYFIIVYSGTQDARIYPAVSEKGITFTNYCNRLVTMSYAVSGSAINIEEYKINPTEVVCTVNGSMKFEFETHGFDANGMIDRICPCDASGHLIVIGKDDFTGHDIHQCVDKSLYTVVFTSDTTGYIEFNEAFTNEYIKPDSSLLNKENEIMLFVYPTTESFASAILFQFK